MSENKPPRVRLPAQVPLIYTNMARIAHSRTEFLIDLARYLPGDAEAVVQARVLLTPLSAKLLARALEQSLSRYEAAYGEIAIPGSSSLADMLFRPPNTPPPEE
jgi:hypothetical protein